MHAPLFLASALPILFTCVTMDPTCCDAAAPISASCDGPHISLGAPCLDTVLKVFTEVRLTNQPYPSMYSPAPIAKVWIPLKACEYAAACNILKVS